MFNGVVSFFNKFLGGFLNEVFYSFSLLTIFIFLYTVMFFFIKKQDWSNEKKHKNSISIRNTLFLIYFISIIFIWSGELKTFIFSAAAIFSAFVIVFKELILSIIGSILTNKIFYVGDYIEYEGIKGKIVDKNFLNTRVLVSEPFLSKELVFPNIHYLTNKIVNLSKFGKFQIYTITISVDSVSVLYSKSNDFMDIAKNIIETHKQKYIDYFKDKKKDQFFFEIPNVNPKLTYNLSDIKNITFTLHYISHPLDKESLEQEILEEYLKKQ